MERDNKSFERLIVYLLVHHDNHFYAGWGDETAALTFDTVRRLVEASFDDVYFALFQCVVNGFGEEIVKLAIFLWKCGAHDNGISAFTLQQSSQNPLQKKACNIT